MITVMISWANVSKHTQENIRCCSRADSYHMWCCYQWQKTLDSDFRDLKTHSVDGMTWCPLTAPCLKLMTINCGPDQEAMPLTSSLWNTVGSDCAMGSGLNSPLYLLYSAGLWQQDRSLLEEDKARDSWIHSWQESALPEHHDLTWSHSFQGSFRIS
jgi:hypothetical protein